MRNDALRLSARHRAWFYGAFAALWVSGVAWLALHWWVARHDADAMPDSSEPWLLNVHGAAAMLALILFGTLIPLHVRPGWRARRNRRTGATMVGVAGALMVTGYGLYYAGGESLRTLTRYVHDGVGTALPLVVAWHVWRGRRSRTLRRRTLAGTPVSEP